MSSGCLAMRRWLNTAPPFCARPAMSMTPAALPSRCAAVPRICAIVAAFAYEFVDDHPLVGIGKLAAFAAAALLGSASLVVNERGYPGYRREIALNAVEVVAVVDGETLGPFDALRIFPWLVGDED